MPNRIAQTKRLFQMTRIMGSSSLFRLLAVHPGVRPFLPGREPAPSSGAARSGELPAPANIAGTAASGTTASAAVAAARSVIASSRSAGGPAYPAAMTFGRPTNGCRSGNGHADRAGHRGSNRSPQHRRHLCQSPSHDRHCHRRSAAGRILSAGVAASCSRSSCTRHLKGSVPASHGNCVERI